MDIKSDSTRMQLSCCCSGDNTDHSSFTACQHDLLHTEPVNLPASLSRVQTMPWNNCKPLFRGANLLREGFADCGGGLHGLMPKRVKGRNVMQKPKLAWPHVHTNGMLKLVDMC
jgi:hypothetical protein